MAIRQTVTATATTTTEVKLAPKVKQKLLTKFKAYQELREQQKAIKAEMKKLAGEIGSVRSEAGVTTIELDGFKDTEVRGYTKKLDHEKLVELGCALAWIKEATTESPKRPYEKITCPGDRESDDE